MGGGNKYLSALNKQRTAFKHNPKSKKTAHILSLPNEGLCYTCHETIEWKKRYRKYKPLTVPGKCQNCQQKNVRRAYHATCDECTLKLQVCGKCGKPKDIINEITSKEIEEKEQNQIREAVRDMTERERRTFYRELEKNGEADNKSNKKDKPVKKDIDEDDEDDEDFDGQEADEGEDGEEDDFDSEDYDEENYDDEDGDEEEDKPKIPKTRAQLTVKSVTQDIEKLSKIFSNDAVGTLIKSKPSSANDDINNKPISNNNDEEEEEEEEEEEDVREVLSAEQMYLKLKEQYKNKSKTEKQSNNLLNNQEEDDEEEEGEEEEEDDDEDYEEGEEEDDEDEEDNE